MIDRVRLHCWALFRVLAAASSSFPVCVGPLFVPLRYSHFIKTCISGEKTAFSETCLDV